jgi:hypothetical protein
MSREITAADVGGNEKKDIPGPWVCWSEPWGCRQTKGEEGFRVQRKGGRSQPVLCDACIAHKAATYQVQSQHAEILICLLNHEVSLCRQARVMAKPEDITPKLVVMKAGHESRVRDLLRAVLDGMKTHGRHGIELVTATYRRYWFDLIGMPYKPANTDFAQIAQSAVPVGDRA